MLDDVAEAGAAEAGAVEGDGRTVEDRLSGDLGPFLPDPCHVCLCLSASGAGSLRRYVINLVGSGERKPVAQYF
ncbi:hypothetical protein Sros01_81740 [Streptomyces roseochromogenus]|nr:hypothetical protein Sros01_81740 [Streptomyces roseochromogenus]